MDDFGNQTPDPLDFSVALDYSTPDPLSQNRVYGCIRAEPDPSLPRYAPPPAHIDLLPTAVDLRSFMPPVYDQSSSSSCTGNAWAGEIQYLRRHNRPPSQDWVPSRLFVYFNERATEGHAGSDDGAAISDGAQVLARLGVCPEAVWPFDLGRITAKPSQAAYSAALPHKLIQPTPVDNRDIHALKSCLALGHPVVFGFTVYESFESRAVAKTGIVPMPRQGERVLGGHAVVLVGYNDQNQVFIVRNSWGEAWGEKGYAFFPYAMVTNSHLASDFWMARACS